MKEIENKIKDSIFGEFNQELIGDKIKLQNKVNKLQRMIDMINFLQPVEEKEEFKIEEEYTFFCKTESEFETALTYFCEKYNDDKDVYVLRPNMFFAEKEGGFGYHPNKEFYKDLQEITFEQFKKYVLNK